MKQMYFDQNKTRTGGWIPSQGLSARGSPVSFPSRQAVHWLSRKGKSQYNSAALAVICCQLFFKPEHSTLAAGSGTRSWNNRSGENTGSVSKWLLSC